MSCAADKFVLRYEITGVLYQSTRRFKIVSTSLAYALGINLWRGTVWACHADGTRRIVNRVYN
jgi:hypothetical protein